MKRQNFKLQSHAVYKMGDAARFIYLNISNELKRKFNEKDIYLFVKLFDEYYWAVGINHGKNEPVNTCNSLVADEYEICKFTVEHAGEYGLLVNETEAFQLLNAELLYCRKIGALQSPIYLKRMTIVP